MHPPRPVSQSHARIFFSSFQSAPNPPPSHRHTHARTYLDEAVPVGVERGEGRLQLVVRELGAHLVAEARQLRGGEPPVAVLVEVVERLAGLLGGLVLVVFFFYVCVLFIFFLGGGIRGQTHITTTYTAGQECALSFFH